VTTARGLGDQDHVCWAHAGDAPWSEAAVAWLDDGRRAGLQLLVAAERPVEATLDLLADLPDRDALLDAGALVVQCTGDLYEPGAPIDAPAQLAVFEQLVAGAAADGFRGVRLVSEGTAFAADPALRPSLHAYEVVADRWIAGGRPLSSLCTYDATRLDDAALAAVSSLHPCSCRRVPWHLWGTASGLAVDGELDAFDAPLVRDVVATADLTGVRVDLGGLRHVHHRVLLAIGAAVRRAGGPVTIAGATPLTRRVWGLLGLPPVTWA
jgi:hypothetical protein